jgi:transcriptional regulator with XRE-family HTH domain
MSITMPYCCQHDPRFVRKIWGLMFASYVRHAREKKGHSVEAAARLAGMETSEWLAIEAGRVPHPEQLHPIADALEVGPDGMYAVVFFCRAAWEA